MISDITGVILAGGKSTRMGRSKARLPFEGQMLIEFIHRRLQEVFNNVALSVNQEDTFPEIVAPKIVDLHEEIGPMGGIASALETEDRIFCVACDMPFLNVDLIRYLCGYSDCDAVLPIWHGRIEVLHAFYSSAVRAPLKEAVRSGRFKLTEALLETHVRYVNDDEIKPIDPLGLSFRNINTPQDYDIL
jgi:molybdopterin-guanine dinucleotide biosynthesis protein A